MIPTKKRLMTRNYIAMPHKWSKRKKGTKYWSPLPGLAWAKPERGTFEPTPNPQPSAGHSIIV